MVQLAVSMAAILLIAFFAADIHGFIINPPSIDSIIDGSSIPDKINMATAGISVDQCTNACKAGVTAMEAFCQLVPNSDVRDVCSSVSRYAGTIATTAICTEFCYHYFG